MTEAEKRAHRITKANKLITLAALNLITDDEADIYSALNQAGFIFNMANMATLLSAIETVESVKLIYSSGLLQIDVDKSEIKRHRKESDTWPESPF